MWDLTLYYSIGIFYLRYQHWSEDNSQEKFNNIRIYCKIQIPLVGSGGVAGLRVLAQSGLTMLRDGSFVLTAQGVTNISFDVENKGLRHSIYSFLVFFVAIYLSFISSSSSFFFFSRAIIWDESLILIAFIIHLVYLVTMLNDFQWPLFFLTLYHIF